MKKILSYSVAMLLVSSMLMISACTKSPLVIKYNLGDFNVSVPANPYYTYQTFTFPISHSDVQAFLSANGGGTDLSKISSAMVNGISAQVTTTGADLSQISSIEVYLKAASNTTSVGDQVAYTSTSGLVSGSTQTALNINGADEKQLLSSDMVLTVKVLPVQTGNAAINFKLTQGYIKIQVNQ